MSHYPTDPFTIRGGCNCSAIRYTLTFPSLTERPLILSAEESNSQGDIRLPQTCICFCDDCRRASGGMVLWGLMASFDQSSFSLLRKEGEGRVEFGAREHLPPQEQNPLGGACNIDNTYFSMYQSSDKALRAFCSKCGTPFLYVYTKPIPPGATSGGMDFYIGTVDKEDIEKLGGLDRFVRADLGLEWVKKLFVKDGTVPWHPVNSMAVCI